MKTASAVLLTTVALAVPTVASADSVIKQPGDHPDYHLEIEPHGILAWPDWYGSWAYYGFFGFGGGARFSTPICKNCFVPKINNNVAITFGADFAFYPFVNGPVGYTPAFLMLPVALQWNFFITHKWSVGPEFGFAPVIGVFYDYGLCNGGCHNFYFTPAVFGVARYHFNDKIALTMRLGFPEFFSIGVSFMI